MKRLGRLVALFTSMVFTVLLSYGVAQAACAESVVSTGGGSRSECYLSGWDDNWCYYDCYCYGNASTCRELDRQSGTEDY